MGEAYVRRTIQVKSVDKKGLRRGIIHFLRAQKETLEASIAAGNIQPGSVEEVLEDIEKSTTEKYPFGGPYQQGWPHIQVQGLGNEMVKYGVFENLVRDEYHFIIKAGEDVPPGEIRKVELGLLETLLGYGCKIEISKRYTS